MLNSTPMLLLETGSIVGVVPGKLCHGGCGLDHELCHALRMSRQGGRTLRLFASTPNTTFSASTSPPTQLAAASLSRRFNSTSHASTAPTMLQRKCRTCLRRKRLCRRDTGRFGQQRTIHLSAVVGVEESSFPVPFLFPFTSTVALAAT